MCKLLLYFFVIGMQLFIISCESTSPISTVDDIPMSVLFYHNSGDAHVFTLSNGKILTKIDSLTIKNHIDSSSKQITIDKMNTILAGCDTVGTLRDEYLKKIKESYMNLKNTDYSYEKKFSASFTDLLCINDTSYSIHQLIYYNQMEDRDNEYLEFIYHYPGNIQDMMISKFADNSPAKVISITYYSNWAWGFDFNVRFVDTAGYVYYYETYGDSQDSVYNNFKLGSGLFGVTEEEMNLNLSMCDTIAKYSQETINKFINEMPTAANSLIEDLGNTANDAGSRIHNIYLYDTVNHKYYTSLISKSGDFTKYNSAVKDNGLLELSSEGMSN